MASESDLSGNPYESPKSAVGDFLAPETHSGFHAEPLRCTAGAGAKWISDGWNHFTQHPGEWVGIALVWFVCAVMIGIFPFIGGLANNVLAPVFNGGVMLGCDAQRRGEPLTVGHLFAGFNQDASQLVLTGLINLAAILALWIFAAIIFFGFGGLSIMQSAEPQSTELLLIAALALLVALSLAIPLMMAMWFAPCLVVFNKMPAFEAMKLSFRACLINFVPFLIYGLVGLAVAIAATLPLGLGWLVAFPVFAAAVYASYRDIFYSGGLTV